MNTLAPGEFASSDGTFRLAIRTLSEGNVVLFIMGERHDIVAWYVLKSESWEELYAGLLRLRARLKRLGVLEDLKYWYDDRCCNGCAQDKITEHVACRLAVRGGARSTVRVREARAVARRRGW